MDWIKQNRFKIGFLAGLFTAIFLLPIVKDFRSEITEYPVLCQNEVPTIYDCVNATPLNRTTYKVNKEKQEVISWMPEFENVIPIERYTKCVVLDLENWTCKFDDGSGRFGFNAGNYISQPGTGSVSLNNIYVSKKQWQKADGEVDYLEEVINN